MSQKSNSGQEQNPGGFVPYIPPHEHRPEMTWTALILGGILAVLFGAANAYLGLIVGMTVTASIPAAVISMAILRGILRRNSILENNTVQTITSVGESLAAGVIFTIPALFIWKLHPSLTTIAIIALAGGILGIIMMIPLRKALIVKEHGVLPYPEGTACAEVLIAGEKGGGLAKLVFSGLGIGALFKFIADGIKAFPSEIETGIRGFKNAAVGMDTLPALLGVGFIIGPRIAGYMLAGAVLGWLGFIPLISYFGSFAANPIFPAEGPISQLGFWDIWSNYLRYIGAGAVAFGGIVSLFKAMPTIASSFAIALRGFSSTRGSNGGAVLRTEQDMPMPYIIVLVLVLISVLAFFPKIHIGIPGALLVMLFGFLFVTVSSRIVGIVGSSSNPVSGMTIAALILITLVLKMIGFGGETGMIAAITIGAVICIAAAMAGDTSQDLKTAFLVGATPKYQQYALMYGVFITSLTIGFVLMLLDQAYGFGSKNLPAPQATLMMMVVEGIMSGNLPWTLIFIGAAAAAIVELMGIGSLPFAVGLYLPIHLSMPIMLGGIIRVLVERREKNEEMRKQKIERGILLSSGFIAGEALMGILIAVAVSAGVVLPENPFFGPLVSLIAFLLVAMILFAVSSKGKQVS
ncbi:MULTISPECIES: OPT family oligopeptide transporter [Aneurinibacillus]|uniref:Oligopeptide transporter, OPT family n=1 Tax=Aneurinibacillus thermoaerophilus TaxID=143495 RepID=A0A1G7WZ28_ANETH|nr:MULTISPECIES: oligopeptide transporter, OPT family [Aneurinibacillus]AMA73870.1 peptide transporter [Aneurinibacillus sp. XH2]MED0674048.1 oligopeptide transporter, OPT family [Aneurinibacillus thermoaerophilus]MED0737777.1 oligopeptide transporter, OPT family [Aneurinibacillus thermoaerophilus]MED0755763.1 oligopeptide transporter, OPT family [Aneurinibacillus thermoaerophilus]MED0759908.1 oligopeptide transporter, OPT family [Aneurinibacillus thermoaerophilus]